MRLHATRALSLPFGYQLTRWADDWVVTCRTRAEAKHVLARAVKTLESLGVTLNREKTRIVHVAQGFEFLGFKIKRGKGQFRLKRDRINSKLNRNGLYAIPTQKSVDRFKDQIRAQTTRRAPLRMGELIDTINPIIRGWGNYYCRSNVRKRFHQLDGWIVRRLWSHRYKRWRNNGWKHYPKYEWRWSTKRRFVTFHVRFQYRNGIRVRGVTIWPKPAWFQKYCDALMKREKRTNWYANRDLSRRTARRQAEGRKNTFPNCPKNFWDMPYS